MTMAKIKTAAGAMAWERVLETDAMVRNNMDMVNVRMNEMRAKKKKFPGWRFRFVMKYMVRLNVMALQILYGMSVSMEARASQDGW